MKQPIIGDALPRRGNFLTKLIATSLLSLTGWKIVADIPNLSKFLIIAAPHTSNWDFLLAVGTIFFLGLKLSWMGKHSLFKAPFGGVFRWLGGIPINRTKEGGGGVVDATIDAYTANDKLIIGIAPEGTRTKVEKWKTGFYHIARGANIPILLVAFDYGCKTVRVGPTFNPTGDITADLIHLQSYFSKIKGKYPAQY